VLNSRVKYFAAKQVNLLVNNLRKLVKL